MVFSELIIKYSTICFCFFVFSLLYRRISNVNQQIRPLSFLNLALFLGFLSFINNLYNISSSTFMIHLCLLVIANFLTYKENFSDTFIYTSVIYMVMCVFEILFSLFIILIPKFENIMVFAENTTYATIFTLAVMLATYSIFRIKKIENNIRKFAGFFITKTQKLTKYVLLVFTIVLGVTCYKIALDYTSFERYLSDFAIVVCFFIIITILIYERLHNFKEKEKQKILLEYMSKYEILIDEQRINRHEMLNNLLTIKSFKDKKSEEFDEVLDQFIKTYDKSSLGGLHTIYNLPTGIKGIIYYKIHDMQAKEIDVMVNISKRTITLFENLKNKHYIEICKILGILLDNALEAAQNSLPKEVIIDVYKEKDSLIIYIENSKKGIIDLNTINNKYVSSKGRKRGMGLFLVKSIINKNDCYILTQEINEKDNFVSKLVIDTQKTSKIN